jgi:hypothetical protein
MVTGIPSDEEALSLPPEIRALREEILRGITFSFGNPDPGH